MKDLYFLFFSVFSVCFHIFIVFLSPDCTPKIYEGQNSVPQESRNRQLYQPHNKNRKQAMAKKTTNQKEPVKLREKKLSNGNISLFLDIYRNGKRHKEYLKLYLINATTPFEREQNRQTLATAQAIKSKRLIELQNGEYSFTRQFNENTPFLEYYRKMVEERRNNPDSKGNWGNWRDRKSVV